MLSIFNMSNLDTCSDTRRKLKAVVAYRYVPRALDSKCEARKLRMPSEAMIQAIAAFSGGLWAPCRSDCSFRFVANFTCLSSQFRLAFDAPKANHRPRINAGARSVLVKVRPAPEPSTLLTKLGRSQNLESD